MKTILVTGASGLIGSEVCSFFHQHEFKVVGLDNNQRAIFFGPMGDTRWNQRRLVSSLAHYTHEEIDIRNRSAVDEVLQRIRPHLIVHAAAQPSHDLAATIPFDDFDTNAVGAVNLLEASRKHCPESPFIHMSTNKVYGDRPNQIKLKELPTRWEFNDPAFAAGIPEDFPIDQSLHSVFGASKAAADTMVQEYGRYFKMPTCCLRGGCLTGPNHSGVELHGFLSYLVKCNLEGKGYQIYGYKGKQVRNNIHAWDVAQFIYAFYQKPRTGEVYNLGGGKQNSCSIEEAFAITARHTGKKQKFAYHEQNRIGDHICYYSDLRKMKAHYPGWDITVTLEETIRQIVDAWIQRSSLASA